MKADLELSGLNQFYGTLNYYKVWLGVNATDGAKYIMDNGYAWLVTDAISVIKTMEKLKNEPFLVINLKILEKQGEAKMVISDGNNNILYEQKYEWTDAKKEIKLYFQNNVIFLSNEY